MFTDDAVEELVEADGIEPEFPPPPFEAGRHEYVPYGALLAPDVARHGIHDLGDLFSGTDALVKVTENIDVHDLFCHRGFELVRNVADKGVLDAIR
jgi:hypothetical protein